MFSRKNEDESKIQSDESFNQVSAETEASEVSDVDSSQIRNLKPSMISEGFDFNGDIKSNGSLTVDGSIVGQVSVDSLIVGVTGSVSGTITAKSINVKGKLAGNVSCSDIIVGGRSIVDGNVTYSSITIQRGGIIKGDLKKS
ncbi:polymer-forming cytoskeletal protein [Polynucleobacter sp. 30F-ANTBAC]|uniref:bactofilin family protein n=1 Tax=Polynucleobacter sp. 30F-ANTBAC TaxID=2689095 RepID=UPI001C0C37B0|nr:polymer-forming cytoskeletal protein [Polynucleobacter sp. 30F-ANTBAC]MBU3599094.1 polymer-forming cytoskeletal protein [Polynucleobacter sp. 30F-ANTBAC]